MDLKLYTGKRFINGWTFKEAYGIWEDAQKEAREQGWPECDFFSWMDALIVIPKGNIPDGDKELILSQKIMNEVYFYTR